MFKIGRIPKKLKNYFSFFEQKFKNNQFYYFRILTLLIAFSWGKKNISSLVRFVVNEFSLRRFNNFLKYRQLGPRGNPSFNGL